jgi:hypothetical protein
MSQYLKVKEKVMGGNRQRGSRHDRPDSAHIVRDYARMKQIAQAFAEGKVKLLILLGAPGKGKGQIVKRAMHDQEPTSEDQLRHAPPPETQPVLGPGLYIKGYISPIKLHIEAYKHRDAPICIDDADVFFADVQLRERTKHLTETDKFKLLAHSSLSKDLIAENVPQEFWTTSPVCIIRNVWDSSDHINQAIESRGMSVVFEPTWAEAYTYIGSWFWDQEIYDYLLEKMPFLREPDIRIVIKAYDLKMAAIEGFHWKSVIDQHITDPAHQLAAEYLNRDESEFGGKEQRIDAWIAAVKTQDPQAAASRATWHRLKTEIEKQLAVSRPDRIILQRNTPPKQLRPSDSAIGGNVEGDQSPA